MPGPGYTPLTPGGVERWPFGTEHLPPSVPEYGGLLPAGMPPGYPAVPYGMGDCRSFLDIPPLANFDDGTTCINPDFDAVHTLEVQGVGVDPSGFPDRLVPDITIAAGGQGTLRITVEREENGLGHLLIKDLVIQRSVAGARALLVDIKAEQVNRVYTNRPVSSDHLFNTSHLSCCFPCPVLLYPNQSLILTFQNDEAVPITVRTAARGRRFMPYMNLPLVQEMERCWSNTGSTPFWLTFDQDVVVPGAVAGVPGSLRSQMTVPGGGSFEWLRSLVTVTSPGAATVFDLTVDVTEGRVGRRYMTGPVNLGAHWATPTLLVAGFPEGMFVAADACHCPPPPQFVRGNTRLIHDFTNSSPDPATVRMTYVGCMHYLDRCPPAQDLDLVRRYGGNGDARMLAEAQKSGERVFLSFFDQNPLYAQADGDCMQAPSCAPEQAPAPAQPAAPPPPPPAPSAPPQPRIVSMFRPNKRWYGPGSTGALPDQLSFGADEQNRLYVVVRDPRTNAMVRFARPGETPDWARQYINQKNQFLGLAGLGAAPGPGEWEAI